MSLGEHHVTRLQATLTVNARKRGQNRKAGEVYFWATGQRSGLNDVRVSLVGWLWCRIESTMGLDAPRSTPRNPLFDGRWFEDEIIILCLRWYFRLKLSYRPIWRK